MPQTLEGAGTMSLEAIWDWIGRANLFELLFALGFVALVLGMVHELVNWLIKCFNSDPTAPNRWWAGCWRVARLLGPGVLFWVWCPYHIFTASNEISAARTISLFAAWIAWPILNYSIGHQDGKKELQLKMDALYEEYEEFTRERERRSQT